MAPRKNVKSGISWTVRHVHQIEVQANLISSHIHVYKSVDLYAKHFIFLLIKNQILFILIQILSMSLVLLIGPKQVDQIHWTVFVPLGLIIHITFNNMRNPGYTACVTQVTQAVRTQSKKNDSVHSSESWLLGLPNMVGKLVGVVCQRMGIWASIIDWTTEHGMENFWTWFSHEVSVELLISFESYNMTHIAWVHQVL